MNLEQFNLAPASDAKQQIVHCVAIAGWSEALVAARPFASLESLLTTAETLTGGWDEQALNQALSAHPRIGENAQGTGKEATLSRGEQSSVNADDLALKQALQAGNAAYEEQFGRVFLIRAKGRSGEEMLSELVRRLANDPQQEQQEALQQLREITLLRLKEIFA